MRHLFLSLIASLAIIPIGHSAPIKSCKGEFFAVQKDELYVNEDEVHAKNLQAQTHFRYSLWEFQFVSAFTDPQVFGFVTSQENVKLSVQLFTGNALDRIILTPEAGFQEQSTASGSRKFKVIDTGSSLYTIFRKKSDQKSILEFTVAVDGAEYCKDRIPFSSAPEH